jgi:diguanylate cyclase (GGDEF)-like protein/PAS domain S-box-containing protein
LPLVKKGEPQQTERLTLTAQGERWLQTQYVPRLSQDGEYLGYYEMSIDIHDMVSAQHERVHALSEFRRFTDNIPEPIAFVDKGWRYKYVNAEFLQLVNRKHEEVIGKSPREALGDQIADTIDPYVESAMQMRPVEYHRQSIDSKGRERWFNVRLVPVLDADGEYDGHYVIGRDTTDLRVAERAREAQEQQTVALFNAFPLPMAFVDSTLTYRLVNDEYTKWAGRSRESLIDQRLQDTLAPATYEAGASYFQRAIKGEAIIADRNINISASKQRWQRTFYTPQLDSHGKVLGFYFAAFDIHDQKLAEDYAKQTSVLLEGHLSVSPMAIVECGEDFTITRWSSQAQRLLGWSGKDALGSSVVRLGIFGSTDAEEIRSLFFEVANTNVKGSRTTRITNAFGKPVWFEWHHSVLRNDNGEVMSILSLGQDITERVETQAKLQHMATHDALTNLPNRRAFADRLEDAIARTKRNQSVFVVMFVDIDGFKLINDQLGHSVGDAVLVEVGKRILSCLREVDFVARISGDEFTIVLESVGSAENAEALAGRILTKIASIHDVQHHEVKVSASIGAAVYPEQGSDPATLLRHADAAMYHAKAGGKNRCQFFTSALDLTPQQDRRLLG